jgi:ribose 5-phosphate isomerase B
LEPITPAGRCAAEFSTSFAPAGSRSWIVGRAVVSHAADRGILVCGSGVGASIAASKLTGVRCALCHDSFSARQGVEDDDMNVLALGARVIGPELAAELVRDFLGARFSGEERHRRRLQKITALERARE